MYQDKKKGQQSPHSAKTLNKAKSQGKESFSMNLGYCQKQPQHQGYSLISDKKINKVDVNKIQTKIDRYIEKHKNKIQKTKQLIRLQRFKPYSSKKNMSSSSSSLSKDKQSSIQSLRSLREKDCYILEKGLAKGQVKQSKSDNKQKLTKVQEDPTTNKQKLQQCYKQKKLPKQWNEKLQTINNFSQSTSTDDSRSSIRQPKFTDFLVGRKLGEGKYGQVYLAKHKKTGMLVALKKMQKNMIDFYAKRQMIQEIKIQYYISHPNVIKLYAFFQDQQSVYLVIQLFVSGHLFKFLQQKKNVQEKLTKSIVKQICQGLKHLHMNNIIHRDIKLENILFQMGMIKICDFGWSIETQEFRETFCGTPLYLSPQILQQKGYDNKIDVWSVGILTFELLYGRVPFQINSQLDFAKIVYEQVKFPSKIQVSEEAKNFIEKCLQKDPQSRPTSLQLLTHPFLKDIDEYQGSKMF